MNTDTAIAGAQAPGTFNVLSFVEETAYPTQTVVVFRDSKSAVEYVELVKQRIELDKRDAGTVDKELAFITEKIEVLGKQITDSGIIFELRGMPPGIRQAILEEPKVPVEGHDEQWREDELVAKTIVKVTNHEGIEDPRIWTPEDVAQLRKFLNEGEFNKLVGGVTEVNFNAMVFDHATDAGFSGRRADVGE